VKFKMRRGYLFITSTFTAFFAIFLALALSQGRMNAGLVTLIFIFMLCLAASCFSLVILSNIWMDSDGFHRSAFGKKLFSIAWGDIKLISDKMQSGANAGETRFMSVVPQDGYRYKVFSRSFMRISEMIVDFPGFVRALNVEIKQRNIPVELSRNDKVVIQEELLLRFPEGQLWNPLRN